GGADAAHGAEAGQVGRALAGDGLEGAVAEDAVGREAVAAGGLAAEAAEAFDERGVGRICIRLAWRLARAAARLRRGERERDRRAAEDLLALPGDGDGRVVALACLDHARPPPHPPPLH